MSDDLPMGWVKTELGEIGEWSSGGTPSRKQPEYYGGSIPWVKTGDLNNSYIESVEEFITEDGLKNSSAKIFPSGTLLLAMYGATIGKTGVLRIEAATNQACGALIAEGFTRELIPFLRYFLIHKVDEFKSIGQGGAQPNISQTIIKQFAVSLPPLNEQRRIVDKLDRIGDRNRTARNELNHIPKLIARYKQAVLAAACSGKLTEDWREANLDKHNLLAYPQNTQDKTSKISQTELSMSEDLYEIPQSWVWKSLSNVCLKITDGEHLTPPLSSEGIPLLSAKDVRNDYLDFSETKYISLEVANKSRSRCNPEIEDILVVSRGATIGRTCRVKTNKLFCLMGSVLLFKINTTIAASCFVELFLKSSFSADRFLSMSGASAQSAIYIRDMKIFPIPIPPLEEQKEIVRRVEKMFEKIDMMEQEYQKAAKLCDRLEQATLAKAFRGELVPQDPDDEPASVLLEQVKREKHVQPKSKSVKSK